MGVLTKEDKDFLSELVRTYFSSRLGNPDALNGGGTVTLAGGVASMVFEFNPLRSVATIVNTDAAADAYINFSSNGAVQTTGILLRANGGSMTFGRGTDIPYTGRVWAISVGAPVLVFTEISLTN